MQFWERSKRLNMGALVCLWFDQEPVTIVFAVICQRDPKLLTKTADRYAIRSSIALSNTVLSVATTGQSGRTTECSTAYAVLSAGLAAAG